ncbi:uracil-DNA glycosylase family protein [Paraburkholderia tropica]|nr:uracil-DNA glycosylase family protein [Paraburkholderia tropica]
MTGSARILGLGCGPLDAPLVFVGEVPGQLGADGSHLPFHGDKSGHNFERLIEQVGISRYEVFVTNAVLCNPKDERGNAWVWMEFYQCALLLFFGNRTLARTPTFL